MARSKSFRPGVNLQSFSRRWKDREVWRNWGLDPDRAKVLYVGRVSVEKNVPMLIDALRDFPEADVVIVGDGPYRVQMQQGLPRAKFLGFQHGELLSTLYASSDLVVFPSTTDTLGQVALEAQASGVCVVVSNQGGPAHFVKHGVTGGIVSDQSPRAWNQSIRSLIADRDRLRAMGAAGAEWMKGFDIDASCAEFWQAHCDLLNQLRASRV